MEIIDKNNPLYLKVRNYIADLIDKGEIKPGDKLPSEFELSEKLEVSRSTLRDSLRMLEESGIIIKKQGIGTFVAPQKILECSIQSLFSTTEMIKSMGMKPGSKDLSIRIIEPDNTLKEKFNISESEKMVCITRTRTANNEPVLITTDYILGKYLPKDISPEMIDESLYELVKKNANVKMEWVETKIRPEITDIQTSMKLDLPEGSLVFRMEHTVIDNNGQPVWFAVELFNYRKFEFTVTRRWK